MWCTTKQEAAPVRVEPIYNLSYPTTHNISTTLQLTLRQG